MVHLPRSMIEEGSDPTARLGPFFKNPLVWMGFALPLFFFSFDGLNHYFPEVPPRVEYELTEMGASMLPALEGFTGWIRDNWPHIDACRRAYDRDDPRTGS